MTLISQADFARRRSVSRKTVTLWKSLGKILMEGDRVDLELSEELLAKYSRAAPEADQVVTLPVTLAVEGNDQGNSEGRGQHPRAEPAPTPVDGEEQVDHETMLALVRSGRATAAEADRIKANALAMRQMLESRRMGGELIEITAAEELFFTMARAARDSWLNWPTRIGPLAAAELGLDADRVTEVLNLHVHRHLEELGEPEFETAQPD